MVKSAYLFLEWVGLCETGKRQSPINIVMFGNTVNDSIIIYNYKTAMLKLITV